MKRREGSETRQIKVIGKGCGQKRRRKQVRRGSEKKTTKEIQMKGDISEYTCISWK
jgi:hypothetical protein